MADVFTAAAVAVLACVGFGLLALWRRRGPADHLMAIQLLGSGGVAVLILLAAAMQLPAVVDAAVTLALLAAFAAAGLCAGLAGRPSPPARTATDDTDP